MNNLEYSYIDNDTTFNNRVIKIDTEHKFFIDLIDNFDKSKYFICKSYNEFCNIDFVITELQTFKNIYLEHKARTNYYSFPTFLIGKVKLEKINENYKDCYIILHFNDGLFFTKFKEEFLNYKITNMYNRKTGKSDLCYELPKSLFKVGFLELIKDIKEDLKPHDCK